MTRGRTLLPMNKTPLTMFIRITVENINATIPEVSNPVAQRYLGCNHTELKLDRKYKLTELVNILRL
jgi:hypothetical protein